MASEQVLIAVLKDIQKDIAGFIAASLVDLDSGMTLAMHSARADFDLTAASAYNSELVKQKVKIMSTLNLTGSIEDMLISLTDQIHLIKLVDAGIFLYLAVDRSQSNLAIVRSAVKRHSAKLA